MRGAVKKAQILREPNRAQPASVAEQWPIAESSARARCRGAARQPGAQRPLIAALAAALALSTHAVAADETTTLVKKTADAPPELRLKIDTPAPGAVIGDPGGMAFVSGQALALFGEYQTFDLVFVIDTSESTAAPSGTDVDGDGEIGHRRGGKLAAILGRVIPLPNSDRADSILAAEVAGMRVLLRQLDPRTTRVGLVSFSGDSDALTADAYTEVPLTSDYDKIERGLDAIDRRGPKGMTNMVSAVHLATIELIGSQTAYSERREGAKRVIMFMTDGTPTLPLENSQLQNAKMAISKAVTAAKFDIRIDTFAIGEEALSEPIVVVEMARVTSGVFTPVRRPGDLRAVFEDVSFSSIEKLEVRNRSTGVLAPQQIPSPDGSFSALVAMKEGKNVIEVYARSTEGTEARQELEVRFLAGAEVQELNPRQLAQRNRLLENRLLELQRRRVEIESDRDEDVRDALRLEIAKERELAKQKAAESARKLEIRPARPDEEEPAP